MKIHQVITLLLKNNTLEDEIIFAHWDLNDFRDNTDIKGTPEQLLKAWNATVNTLQGTFNDDLDFLQTSQTLRKILEEEINGGESVPQ